MKSERSDEQSLLVRGTFSLYFFPSWFFSSPSPLCCCLGGRPYHFLDFFQTRTTLTFAPQFFRLIHFTPPHLQKTILALRAPEPVSVLLFVFMVSTNQQPMKKPILHVSSFCYITFLPWLCPACLSLCSFSHSPHSCIKCVNVPKNKKRKKYQGEKKIGKRREQL
ncbi:hypothetical protein DFJ73DRAFT_863565 [Zopfochytrium polystomum]|nr:hypothetical protein DFJ73DRAFT_863565 [Zopfochytrium polystomum]